MKIIASKNTNMRLDQYIFTKLEDYSRSKISKLIKNKDVMVNSNYEKSSYIVKENDCIEIDLSSLEIKNLEPENLNIEIIYEDEFLAILNKPAGIISHPTNTIRNNTVVNFLLHRYDNLSMINGNDRPGIVHRLDMDTQGLMIVAFDDNTAMKLKSMFKNRTIIKKYRAIVNGNFENFSGEIEKNISRNLKNRKIMSVTEDDSGKYAKTSYNVIEQIEGYSFLDVLLHTGRTHQIRVHLSSINRPIVGDKDYNKIEKNFNLETQLLQAYYLEFKHPINNEILKIEIPFSPEIDKYYKIIFGSKNEYKNN